ncbi:hypothetical protein JW826_02010 [Candidatus Woesearchaeota archaeon]|nr:hypothetical protein [Candidatus Woesearchaeota archaeon]
MKKTKRKLNLTELVNDRGFIRRPDGLQVSVSWLRSSVTFRISAERHSSLPHWYVVDSLQYFYYGLLDNIYRRNPAKLKIPKRADSFIVSVDYDPRNLHRKYRQLIVEYYRMAD